MKPFSKIMVMDVYQNPVTQTEWLVLEKNNEEKMVQVVMMGNEFFPPMWKKNTDKIFRFPQVQFGVE